MSDQFWDECRAARLTLDWSLYPAMEKATDEIQRLCEDHGVSLTVNRYSEFFAGINPAGDSDPVRSMAYCRSQFYCPFLNDSRLFVCAFPATTHYFNDEFARSIPADAGIDIFDSRLDGDEILKRLDTPVETCRHCSCLYESHPWEQVRVHRAEDYEVRPDR